MDRRTKILGLLFGGAIAFAVLSNVIYPQWIKPLIELDQRLVSARERRDKLQEEEERIERAAGEYRAMVNRVGTFDIDRAATEIRDRINALIDKHKLRADSVAPSRSRRDRKTDVESMTINVRAVGPLDAAIGFLADLYELPQFMRVGNVSIYPGSTGRDVLGPTPMNLRVPIEIRVLPQQKIVGRIDLDDIEQPEQLVRHEPRDYTPIWDGTPFDDWIPPVPLRAEITPSATSVTEGERVWLQAKASGGLGRHTFAWAPSDKLTNPDGIRTQVNTNEPGQYTFTLTATDEKGESATASVNIVVMPKREPVVQRDDRPKPPPPPPPRPDARWTDRMHRRLVMTLGRTGYDGRLDELMVSNQRSRTTEYYAVDEDFDGGMLIHVHQTGGLVRRKDDPRHPEGQEGYYVYPIGETLDRDIPIAQADAFPELQRVAELDRAQSGGEPTEEAAQALREVQPRGADEAPLRIGLVGQKSDEPTPEAIGKGDAGSNANGDNNARGKTPARRPGRQPVRRPR